MIVGTTRGISAVGSAFEWHSKGQGFDSPMLHHLDVLRSDPQDILFAGVMELADVPDSKSGGSDTVPVRPRSPAPKFVNSE